MDNRKIGYYRGCKITIGKSCDGSTTVGDYLIKRLEQAGLKYLFGVPGDCVLDFMDHVVASNITLIGNCNELKAGYAADAYARLNGIGAICVTYGVGGLSTLNSAAGAYAEQVPVKDIKVPDTFMSLHDIDFLIFLP